MRDWYRIRAAANEDTAEVEIFDDIGSSWFSEGVTVKGFKKEWDAIRDRSAITLLLNSYGGSVFEGLALYNVIAQDREKVTVEVLGIAASIASVIGLAGGRLVMREGTFFMIHDPFGFAMGTAAEMRKMAETLDKIGGEIADIYEPRTGLTRDEVVAAMSAETWYTAAEALAVGFADEIVTTTRKGAPEPSDDARQILHIPEAILRRREEQTMQIDTAAIAATGRAVGRLDERLAQLTEGN